MPLKTCNITFFLSLSLSIHLPHSSMSLPPLSLSHFLFVYLFHNKVTLLCWDAAWWQSSAWDQGSRRKQNTPKHSRFPQPPHYVYCAHAHACTHARPRMWTSPLPLSYGWPMCFFQHSCKTVSRCMFCLFLRVWLPYVRLKNTQCLCVCVRLCVNMCVLFSVHDFFQVLCFAISVRVYVYFECVRQSV